MYQVNKENAFATMRECFYNQRTIWIDGAGPYKVGAFDPNNNQVLLIKYRNSDLYESYLKLIEQLSKRRYDPFNMESMKLFHKEMEEKEGEYWHLLQDFKLWVSSDFFRLNTVTLGHLKSDHE
jgi:hypothetical protein